MVACFLVVYDERVEGVAVGVDGVDCEVIVVVAADTVELVREATAPDETAVPGDVVSLPFDVVVTVASAVVVPAIVERVGVADWKS